jgi:uncharacterized protein HemX
MIALAGLGYGIYSGEEQKRQAKAGRKRQEQQQRKAEHAAVAAQRRADDQERRASEKTPDLNVLLGDQALPKPGTRGVNADRLLLGRPGVLGY